MSGGIGEKSNQVNSNIDPKNIPFEETAEVTVGGIYKNDQVGSTLYDAVKQIISAPYQKPGFSSFGGISTKLELGYQLTGNQNFTFSINLPDNVQDNTIDLLENNVKLLALQPKVSPLTTSLSHHYNTPTGLTYKIQGINTKGEFFSRNLYVNWYHTVYYGVAENKELHEITPDWVKATFTTKLTNGHPTQFVGTIGTNQRLYYFYPDSWNIRYFKTDLGKEGDSLLSPGGLEIKTPSQITHNLAGITYAICKNEQSNIGYSERTLIQ